MGRIACSLTLNAERRYCLDDVFKPGVSALERTIRRWGRLLLHQLAFHQPGLSFHTFLVLVEADTEECEILRGPRRGILWGEDTFTTEYEYQVIVTQEFDITIMLCFIFGEVDTVWTCVCW